MQLCAPTKLAVICFTSASSCTECTSFVILYQATEHTEFRQSYNLISCLDVFSTAYKSTLSVTARAGRTLYLPHPGIQKRLCCVWHECRGLGAYLELEVLAVAVPAGCSAEAVQLLAGALQVYLQELICPCQLQNPACCQLVCQPIFLHICYLKDTSRDRDTRPCKTCIAIVKAI